MRHQPTRARVRRTPLPAPRRALGALRVVRPADRQPRTLGRPYELAGSLRTQLVHKEWPEPRARPDKAGRRGNLDMAVLHPDGVRRATIDQFRQGRIDPIIGIEVGLNYGLQHLQDDAAKLINSEVPHPYLVHLVNNESGGADAVEAYVATCPVNVAYVWASPGRTAVKLTGETEARLLRP